MSGLTRIKERLSSYASPLDLGLGAGGFLIVVLLPLFMSFENDVFGYGTGIGPAGGDGGLRQTSGNEAITFPDPALQAISSLFA